MVVRHDGLLTTILAPIQPADAITAAHLSRSQSSAATAKVMALVTASVVVTPRLMMAFGDAMPLEASRARTGSVNCILKVAKRFSEYGLE